MDRITQGQIKIMLQEMDKELIEIVTILSSKYIDKTPLILCNIKKRLEKQRKRIAEIKSLEMESAIEKEVENLLTLMRSIHLHN